MGYSSYSDESRRHRSASLNYMSVGESRAATDAVFTQNKKGECHAMMNPKGLTFRECRDSETHPKTVPIIVALDVTGSMGKVPMEFCKNGLPTMMTTIIQRGTLDASVCFMAIGDHTCDDAPIQVGQFESGDAELDMWLTRTWLEGGGGPNDGESYALPWYVAAKHVKVDSCEKRGTKGFLFTVGDEPCLSIIQGTALKEIFGESEYAQSGIRAKEALEEAQKCFNVYHLALSDRGEVSWKNMLGQNYIRVENYTEIPALIAEIVNSYNTAGVSTPERTNGVFPQESDPTYGGPSIML